MCDTLNKMRGRSADYILNKYYGEQTIPIDIVTVAKKIGIKLSDVDFTEMERSDIFKEKVEKKGRILGSVRVKGDDVYISYSDRLPKNDSYGDLSEAEKREKLINRQRFTIAHEIAHCCLNHMPANGDGSHIEYRMEQSSYCDPREREANILAGELLLPSDIFINYIKNVSFVIDLDKFSSIFKVSKSVIRERVKYLVETKMINHNIHMIELVQTKE